MINKLTFFSYGCSSFSFPPSDGRKENGRGGEQCTGEAGADVPTSWGRGFAQAGWQGLLPSPCAQPQHRAFCTLQKRGNMTGTQRPMCWGKGETGLGWMGMEMQHSRGGRRRGRAQAPPLQAAPPQAGPEVLPVLG